MQAPAGYARARQALLVTAISLTLPGHAVSERGQADLAKAGLFSAGAGHGRPGGRSQGLQGVVPGTAQAGRDQAGLGGGVAGERLASHAWAKSGG